MKRIVLFILTVVCIGNVSAQLSGTYTINSGATTLGTNYNSFGDAITALNASGIGGAVVFNVVPNSGPYNEQVHLDSIAGLTSTHTLTINGNGNLVYATTIPASKQVVAINGCPYVTIDSLRIKAFSLSDAVGIQVMNGSHKSVIKNCVIDLDSIFSSTSVDVVGIVVNGSDGWTFGSGNTDSVTIENNVVYGGVDGVSYGIKVIGGGFPATYSTGHNVMNNTVYDGKLQGISIEYVSNTLVSGNDVSNPTLSSGDFTGIFLGAGTSNVRIEKNKIHDSHNTTAGSADAFGIRIGNSTPTSGYNLIANNLIYDMNGQGSEHGIYCFNSSNVKIYHNTISLDDAAANSGNSYGFYHTSAPNSIEFINNIISITKGGTGSKFAMYFNNGTPSITSNYNVLYVNSSGSGSQNIGYWNSSAFASLANWQAANSGIFDTNSVAIAPSFISISGGNFKTTSSLINNIATPLVLVPTDFDGVVRSTINPDPGAYETAPPPLDAGITSIDSLQGNCAGNIGVWATLKNFGTDTLKSVNINWSINGTNQTAIQLTTNLPVQQSQAVQLGSVSVTAGNSYNFSAYSYLPNGMTDTLNANDTAHYLNYETAMSGLYTVGVTGDYTDIKSAVDDLVKRGICGPTFVDIDSGTVPYVHQLNFLPIAGTSPQDSIVFEGNGSRLIVDVSNKDFYAVQFSGSSYITFRDFNITTNGTNPNDGGGIVLTNGAEHIHVHDCMIDMYGVNTSSFTTAAVLFESFQSTLSGSHCRFENNLILGYGVRDGFHLQGSPGMIGCYGNIFKNNTIKDNFHCGFYLSQTDSTVVDGNDISRPDKLISWAFRGIYLYQNSQNTSIMANRIHNPSDQDETLQTQCIGIDVSSCDAPSGKENKIINNVIYNFNSRGLHIGINNEGSDGLHCYHNTISLNFYGTFSGEGRGLSQRLQATNIQFKNNIISTDRTGNGNRYVYYFETISSNILTDNNGIYIDTTSSRSFTGKKGNATFKSLNDWRNFSANANKDVKTVMAEPNFSGFYIPETCAFDNIGDSLGVQVDAADSLRDLIAPDPGAFEFSVDFDAVGVSNDTTVCLDKTFELEASSGFTSYLWSTGGTSRKESILALDLGIGTHAITVTALDNNFCESINEVLVTVEDCNVVDGINESAFIHGLNIFPNPAENQLSISLESKFNERINLILLDAKGNKALYKSTFLQEGKNKLDLDISSLGSGLYLLRLETKKEQLSKQLIIK